MKRLKKCYMCGSLDVATNDHVPPKSFFMKEERKNLITVPCCIRCNNGFSKTDEDIRAWFSSAAGASYAGKVIYEREVKGRTFPNNGRLARRTQEMVVSWTIMTSEGPQVVSGLCLDSTVVDPFMIRCAKAVVAHAWPDLACWDVDYKVFQLEDRPYDEVFIESLRLELFKDREKGLGVFRYSGAVGEEGTSAVILFLFYGVVAFGVRWSPKE